MDSSNIKNNSINKIDFPPIKNQIIISLPEKINLTRYLFLMVILKMGIVDFISTYNSNQYQSATTRLDKIQRGLTGFHWLKRHNKLK
ncbi:TPA: hypothetical protein H1Q11_002157 [Salmonella enterica]|nr:hypothetical protein [Salmonella enterica]